MNIDLNGNTLIQGYFSGIGEELTALNASNLTTGTVPDARLGADVTLQGNTFNEASKLVQFGPDAMIPFPDAGGGVPLLDFVKLSANMDDPYWGGFNIAISPDYDHPAETALFSFYANGAMQFPKNGNPDGVYGLIVGFGHPTSGRHAGNIDFSGNDFPNAAGGSIGLKGGNAAGAWAGNINGTGGSGVNAHGGIINFYGGSAAGTNGGTIDISGGTTYPGGSINLKDGAGTIQLGTGATLTLPNTTGTVALTSDAFPHDMIRLSGSGTWTIPSGVTSFKVTCIGGGGSGSAQYFYGGGGGGGGGAVIALFKSLAPGTSFTYAVGTGGAGVTCSSTVTTIDGNNGGDTTFGGLIAGGGGAGNFVGDAGSGGGTYVGSMTSALGLNGQTGGYAIFGATYFSTGGGNPGAGFGNGASYTNCGRGNGAPSGYGGGSAGFSGNTSAGSSVAGGDGLILIEY